jgi:molecular chaperone GrpE
MQTGLQMIMEQFRTQLRRYGAERILIQKGMAFDPEIHEAVLHLPTRDWPPGSVIEEVSAGFRLKGRMVRAARVVVAASPDRA